jgi:uncharacterized membrane protein
MVAVIGNENSLCLAAHTLDFAKATASLHLTYDMTSFTDFNASTETESLCDQILNPEALGYDPFYDFNEFALKIDMTALSIAVAVSRAMRSAVKYRSISCSFTLYNTV